MPDEGQGLIIDDDWKEQARREKERLAREAESAARTGLPEPSFADLVNIIAIQAMVGLGLVAGPGGEGIPPQPEVARHFIDLLQLLGEKTRNNVTPDEQHMLEAVLYDLRMRYVELASAPPPAAPPPPPPQP